MQKKKWSCTNSPTSSVWTANVEDFYQCRDHISKIKNLWHWDSEKLNCCNMTFTPAINFSLEIMWLICCISSNKEKNKKQHTLHMTRSLKASSGYLRFWEPELCLHIIFYLTQFRFLFGMLNKKHNIYVMCFTAQESINLVQSLFLVTSSLATNVLG